MKIYVPDVKNVSITKPSSLGLAALELRAALQLNPFNNRPLSANLFLA
jgi:hypothetical protein